MADKEKNYLSFTGLKEFIYGELDENANKIKDEEAERIKFLQEMSVSTPQSIEKAHGDNTVAEMAVATEATQLTTQFHTLPIEDRATIYGWIKNDSMYALPASPNPPYIACMFTKTKEDGSTEHIGFPKGKFMIADDEGATKGESVEFGNASTEGQFMPREVDGFEEEVAFVVVSDEKGETENRNALYKKIFGVEHPDAGKETEPEGA